MTANRMIGYMRVSTDEQDLAPQREALLRAGCIQIFEDVASGAKDRRTGLTLCMANLRPGDILVVTRLDRISRSLKHFVTLMDELQARSVLFRSLSDHLDTSGPQGQMLAGLLGVIAQFERSLIQDRTRAKLAHLKSQGVKLGNPGLIARDPMTMRIMRAAANETRLAKVREASREWIDIVRVHRPTSSWDAVVNEINRRRGKRSADITLLRKKTLIAQVKVLVKAGDLPADVLSRQTKSVHTLLAAQAALAYRAGHPNATLAQIGDHLIKQGLRPPRAALWSRESIRKMLSIG